MNFKLPWYFSLAFIVCWPAAVLSEPLVKANVQGIEITVYSEDCQLKHLVANLPKRATWVEKGKTYEGCAGAVPPLGVLTFYFAEDKSVAVVPMDAFAKVTGV